MRTEVQSRFRALLAGIALTAALFLCGMFAAQAQAAIEIIDFEAGAFNADGSANLQAGAHPFEARTFFEFAQQPDAGGDDGIDHNTPPVENVKDIEVTLPPGLIGNPEATPQCTEDKLFANACPAASQVGVTTLGLWNGSELFPFALPVYNMVPDPGQTANFAFLVLIAPVHIVASLNTDGDYSLTTNISDISELLPLGYSDLSFWGVPGDPAHDGARGLCVGTDTEEIDTDGDGVPDEFGDGDPFNDDLCPIGGTSRKPFLTLPSVCGVQGVTRLRARSWNDPGTWTGAVSAPQQLEGCERQRFNSNIGVFANPPVADSPTGLTVDLRIPQNDNPDGLGTPPLKKTVVQLPEGLSVSPAAADGLQGCTPAQFGLGSKANSTCPTRSDIGDVSITTPLLADPMEGDIYLAQPTASRLLSIYLVVRGPGLVVKLPGSIDAHPNTGRLTATFDNTPMVPFSRFLLQFKGGPRAPLATPASCGLKTANAQLTSWNGSMAPVNTSSTFNVIGCSGGFAPGYVAGATNPVAGRNTGFLMRLSRPDGQQQISRLDVQLPSGLTGRLASVPLCGEAQAAAGTCGPDSQVGTTRVAAGAGASPFNLGGRVYLTGPYGGAPLGLSIVVPAIAGPFDLGTVVVRAAVQVDRTTTRLRVISDPLPSIIKGIPLRIRTVEVNLDRDGFMLTGTSCRPSSVTARITSTAGATSDVSSRYQLADCARLGFNPKMTTTLTGRNQVRPGRHPGLNVRLQVRRNQANPRRVALTLPNSLALDAQNLPDPCTQEQLAALSCPASSRVGSTSAATPLLSERLRGGVFLVARPRGLPALAAVLRGQLTVVLEGETAITRKGVRNTFATIPDVPIRDFRLNLRSGSRGILTPVRRSLCARKHRATLAMRGHNGKAKNTTIALKTPCRNASRSKRSKKS
jgi:hypothetical protein